MLQIEQDKLETELAKEQNSSLIQQFASEYDIRTMLLRKDKEGSIKVEFEFSQSVLSECNILLIKKSQFMLTKGIKVFQIAEMLQVVNLDLHN